MIPAEDESPKTILDSFSDTLSSHSFDKRMRLSKLLDELFIKDLSEMKSYDEWHEYLGKYGIILVRSREEQRWKESWHKWSERKFMVVNNPAEKDKTELMLVPHETIEKMIVLGILRK